MPYVNRSNDNSTVKIVSSNSKLFYIPHHILLSSPTSLLSFRLQSPHLAQERDAAINSANKSLSTVIEPARLRRAQLRECEERVREVWEGLETVRKDNDRRMLYHNAGSSFAVDASVW